MSLPCTGERLDECCKIFLCNIEEREIERERGRERENKLWLFYHDLSLFMVHLVCNLSSSWAINLVNESQGMEIKKAIFLTIAQMNCLKFHP